MPSVAGRLECRSGETQPNLPGRKGRLSGQCPAGIRPETTRGGEARGVREDTTLRPQADDGLPPRGTQRRARGGATCRLTSCWHGATVAHRAHNPGIVGSDSPASNLPSPAAPLRTLAAGRGFRVAVPLPVKRPPCRVASGKGGEGTVSWIGLTYRVGHRLVTCNARRVTR